MAKVIVAMLAGICLLGIDAGVQADNDQDTSKAALNEGDAFPQIESVDDQGQPWKSADHVGKKTLVIYFYPGDFTEGCIKQAEKFREGLQMLTDVGFEVVGVSGDSVETHQLFKSTYGLEYTLLADAEGKLAESLGVPLGKGGKARTRTPQGQPIFDAKGKSIIVERKVTLPRWTFVIDREGKVVAKRTAVNPATEAAEILKIIVGKEEQR